MKDVLEILTLIVGLATLGLILYRANEVSQITRSAGSTLQSLIRTIYTGT
ncbi:MAG: hypothetical protein RMJ67_08905 [Elusimicrobiota bacterium]|nr:hypothetical protein [Endomicrobiia bacterium]MDW8166615.1 hypothetical protein [Elusimicrobiota bacterium]